MAGGKIYLNQTLKLQEHLSASCSALPVEKFVASIQNASDFVFCSCAVAQVTQFLWITRFVDFGGRKNATYRELDILPSSGERVCGVESTELCPK